jgi:hypothetical protein
MMTLKIAAIISSISSGSQENPALDVTKNQMLFPFVRHP